VYWIRYSVGGKPYRESANTTRKEEALALLRKRKTEIFEGSFFPDLKKNDLTMDGLRKMWLEAASGKKTIEHDRHRLDRIVEFLGARTLITSVTSDDVERLRQHLKKQTTRSGKQLADATVNRYVVVLKSALNLASKRHYRHRDPMAGIKMYKERNQRDRICTEEEYNELVNKARPELRLAIVLAYWTGMRQNEIAELRWRQIDLKDGVVRLSRGDTKEVDEKAVPLPTHAVAVLRDMARAIDGALFTVKASTLSKEFSVLTRELGIDDLRYHDLRHTAITRMRRAGVDIMTIKAITGHKVLATLERYNKITVDDLREAMDKAEKLEL
jgi:integrase